MFKQKTPLIVIITVLCGLVAGLISFYQQQKTSQTISVDIISTIVPTEQEKTSAMAVTIDSLQYNQTLAAVLNNKKSTTSWNADLNSAVLHAQTHNTDQKKADMVPAKLVSIVQENANVLNAKHYNNKISSKISLLTSSSSSSSSSPSSPYSPFYPYLITLLGLLVGFIISTIFLKTNSG